MYTVPLLIFEAGGTLTVKGTTAAGGVSALSIAVVVVAIEVWPVAVSFSLCGHSSAGDSIFLLLHIPYLL